MDTPMYAGNLDFGDVLLPVMSDTYTPVDFSLDVNDMMSAVNPAQPMQPTPPTEQIHPAEPTQPTQPAQPRPITLQPISKGLTSKTGIVNGDFITYYPNNTICRYVRQTSRSDIKEVQSYYPDGTIKSLYCVKNGKKQGRVLFYYPNGYISDDFQCIDDIYNGRYYRYFPSNRLEWVAYYKKGKFVKFEYTADDISKSFDTEPEDPPISQNKRVRT